MAHHDNDDDDGNRQTKALAGLAIALALAVSAFFLFQHLRKESQIEDCLMQGRTDCDAVVRQ